MESKRCNMPARLAIFLAIFTVACAARAIDTLDDGFRARHRSLLATEELESKIDDLMKGHDDMWKADHLKHDKDETAKHSKTGTGKLDKTATGKTSKTSTGKLDKTTSAKYSKESTGTAKYEVGKYATGSKYESGNFEAVPVGTPFKKDEDYLADCVKTAHYKCNAFLPLYGPCFMKHWSLCIAEEVYEEKDAEWEDHKYSKYDK